MRDVLVWSVKFSGRGPTNLNAEHGVKSLTNARAERARSHFSKTSFRQLFYPAVPGGLSPAEKADKTCTDGDVAEWVLSPCCPACCCWNSDPGPLGTSGADDRPRRGSVRRGPDGTRPTGRLNAAKSPRTRRRTTIFACAGDLLHSVCSAVATRLGDATLLRPHPAIVRRLVHPGGCPN